MLDPHTSARISAPSIDPRRVLADLHRIRHQPERLQLVAPPRRLHDDALPHLPGGEPVAHVEDEVAERVDDRYAVDVVHPLHPVRMAADDQVGSGFDQPLRHRALLAATACGCTARPSAAARPPRPPVAAPTDHPATWSRSAWLITVPVRGGIRTDNAPGSPGNACGVSPIALKPTNAKLVPSTSSTAGRLASARSEPAPNALDRRSPPSRSHGLDAARPARSHPCGCWPVTGRRSPLGATAAATPASPRTSR